MIIGIDVRPAVEEPAGIGKLMLNLTKQLARLDSENTYVLYSDRNFDFGITNPNFKRVVRSFGTTLPGRLLWQLYLVYRARRVDRLDTLISGAALGPAALTKRLVTLIVADLTHILFPHQHVTKSTFAGRFLLRRALRHARHVIAISNQTRNDIVKYTHGAIPPQTLSVAYIACEDEFAVQRPEADILEVRQRYNLREPYFLSVGTIEPRKNHRRLVLAFEKVAAIRKPIDLVLAGRKGWKWEETLETIQRSEFASRIHVLEFVPQKDLPLIYSGATVFVYPSLYEGFGIPPLEAMASGIPVITSTTASLPEVVGDAAIFVDPTNVDDLAKAMLRLLDDNTMREQLSGAGRRRSTIFSWESFADSVLTSVRGQA